MAATQEETAIFHLKWDEIIWCPQCVENILEVLLKFSHSYKFWKFLTFKVEAIKSILAALYVVVLVKEPSDGNHKVSPATKDHLISKELFKVFICTRNIFVFLS